MAASIKHQRTGLVSLVIDGKQYNQ